MECPKCGIECEEGAEVCAECGTQLPVPEPPDEPALPDASAAEAPAEEQVVVCIQCGTALPTDTRYCHVCGATVVGAVPVMRQRPAPVPLAAPAPTAAAPVSHTASPLAYIIPTLVTCAAVALAAIFIVDHIQPAMVVNQPSAGVSDSSSAAPADSTDIPDVTDSADVSDMPAGSTSAASTSTTGVSTTLSETDTGESTETTETTAAIPSDLTAPDFVQFSGETFELTDIADEEGLPYYIAYTYSARGQYDLAAVTAMLEEYIALLEQDHAFETVYINAEDRDSAEPLCAGLWYTGAQAVTQFRIGEPVDISLHIAIAKDSPELYQIVIMAAPELTFTPTDSRTAQTFSVS